jgi:hypothetical protein
MFTGVQNKRAHFINHGRGCVRLENPAEYKSATAKSHRAFSHYF